MTIYLPISDFLYELFPEAKGKGDDALVAAIRASYTHGDAAPEVVVRDGMVEVTVNFHKASGNAADLQRAIGLCERGDYARARPILQQLAERDPSNSEVHRILGQISSDEGNQDAAIDHLIDALRWDPKNQYALTMMGNIWAKHRDDIDTAMKYYEQALVADPDDHVAANNIGTNMLQLRKYDEAQRWFDRAMSINASYPNTRFGLSILCEQRGDLTSAFNEAIEAMKLNPRRDELAKQSFAQAGSIARKLIALGKGSEIVDRFAQELEASSGKKILLEVDRHIPTAAKLEVAENYDREEHVVRFKPDYPNVEHLQAHELFHLKFIVEARAANANMLFVSRKKHREAFIRSLEKHVTKLNQMGYGEETLANYLTALYEGITRQVHNAPIDLFIEQGIHDDFPEMRPYQFQSLWALLGEALHATTEPSIVELTPPSVLSKSKTFNLLLAYQFKELYGVDMTAAFKASAAERTMADRFYAEFVEYRSDREGGEEYEVVDHWGHDLQLEA